jgi:hypothetical protein
MKSLLTLGTQNDHAYLDMASSKTKANGIKQYKKYMYCTSMLK